MNVFTLLAQFGAVFAAAFLAFVLENVRERRRTARWVREHLRHLRDAMQSADEAAEREVRSNLQRQLAALDVWLVAEQPSDMSDEQWQAASESLRTSISDLSAVLRSEALTVLPQHLAAALDRLERTGGSLQMHADIARAARNDMLPAWHERCVPLNDAEASRVRMFREALADVEEQLPEIFATLRNALDALDRWR